MERWRSYGELSSEAGGWNFLSKFCISKFISSGKSISYVNSFTAFSKRPSLTRASSFPSSGSWRSNRSILDNKLLTRSGVVLRFLFLRMADSGMPSFLREEISRFLSALESEII